MFLLSCRDLRPQILQSDFVLSTGLISEQARPSSEKTLQERRKVKRPPFLADLCNSTQSTVARCLHPLPCLGLLGSVPAAAIARKQHNKHRTKRDSPRAACKEGQGALLQPRREHGRPSQASSSRTHFCAKRYGILTAAAHLGTIAARHPQERPSSPLLPSPCVRVEN